MSGKLFAFQEFPVSGLIHGFFAPGKPQPCPGVFRLFLTDLPQLL